MIAAPNKAQQPVAPSDPNSARPNVGQVLSVPKPDESPVTPAPTSDPFDLKNGVDYFADYNIFNVSDPLPGDDDASVTHNPRDGQPYIFHYINRTTSKFKFKWLSTKPRVALIPNFLSEDECDQVVNTASPNLARSQVAVRKGEEGQPTVQESRTSSQTWLSVTSGIGQTISNRIFELTGFKPGSSELMQVLRYQKGQKYNAHLDYFSPELYGKQSSNRAATVFLYLRSVEEGGHTWFPNADGKPLERYDWVSCKRGLGYKPKKGNVVVFYDMTPTGGYDESSLHGGCPVIKGEKWGGTLWLRIDTLEGKSL